MRECATIPMDDWLRQRAVELALAMALGVAFAVIGPFSTDESPFLAALGYWAGLLACWFLAASLVELPLRGLRAYREGGVWRRRALVACAASLPMLLVTAPATSALSGFEATVDELLDMYWKIALVGLGVLILADGILKPPAAPAVAPRATDGEWSPLPQISAPQAAPDALSITSEEAPASVALWSPLTDRLPANLRGPIVCLEMEDHYVRVHTTRGSALVLMRLGDAMKETAPTVGVQSHRSWWVAADSVEGFERAGRAGRLRLANGLVAPVSQRHLRSIEAAFGAPGRLEG